MTVLNQSYSRNKGRRNLNNFKNTQKPCGSSNDKKLKHDFTSLLLSMFSIRIYKDSGNISKKDDKKWH